MDRQENLQKMEDELADIPTTTRLAEPNRGTETGPDWTDL
jgi:hypothetical protein